MKSKWLTGVVVLVVVIAAWCLLPGLRTFVRGIYKKHGGWTEKARRDDPVGFLEYAEGRLEKHLVDLKRSRVDMKEGLKRIDDETTRTQGLQIKARELAGTFRDSFKAAEQDDSYPAAAAGSSYSRAELVEQVRLILLQDKNYSIVLDGFSKARRAARDADVKLLRQVTDTQAALATLPAKKEIVRVNKLAGEVQELLAQIDALIYENEEILQAQPVRTVEQLVAGSPSSAGEDVDVMAFLGTGR